MSADGSFSEHIKKTCLAARNLSSWILRTFSDRSHSLMLTTWKSLVLPILDYCSQLWSPQKKGEIQQIEDIQRSFTRKIHSHGRESYWERLSSLHLYSLERRRERYKIIYVWKALEGMVPNFTVEDSQIKCQTSLRFGRQCVIPRVTRTATDRIQSLREGSLSVNGPKLFNMLPQKLRNMTNVGLPKFKEKLDKFLSTIPDEPLCPGYTANRRAESNSLIDMVPACNM